MSLLSILNPYTAHEFLSLENLVFADEAVSSVFSIMLGLHTAATSTLIEPVTHNRRTAIVGFSGSLRGSCELRIGSLAARAITSAMLGGAPIEEGDESIDDAVGELCNMIAGGWKNRIVVLASTCSLSPPTVISGCDYKVHTNSATLRVVRTYTFAGQSLQLHLRCLDLSSV